MIRVRNTAFALVVAGTLGAASFAFASPGDRQGCHEQKPAAAAGEPAQRQGMQGRMQERMSRMHAGMSHDHAKPGATAGTQSRACPQGREGCREAEHKH